MLRVMSQLSENFIFSDLGLTLFTERNELFRWGFILFTFLAVLVGRAAGVFPLARLINWNHHRRSKQDNRSRWFQLQENSPRDEQQERMLSSNTHGLTANESRGSSDSTNHSAASTAPPPSSSNPQHADAISMPYQIMMWWAGLRGAIAFALSMDIQTANKREIRTATLVVVVLSIVLLGGTIPFVIRYLAIPTGVQGMSIDSDDEGVNDLASEVASGLASPVQAQREDRTHWFMSFDDKFIRPVFSRPRSTWQRSRSSFDDGIPQ